MDELVDGKGQDQNLETQPVATTDAPSNEPKTALEALERAIPIEGETKPEPKVEEVKPAVEDKKPETTDDLYKMPEGLQPKSQERFTKLVESNQQKDSEIQQMREGNQWVAENFTKDEQGIQDLIGFAEYRNALKSGNFDAAGQLLQAQIQQFTILTGKQLQASPLQEFPDLQQRIDAFELDESDALEIARFRKQQAMQQGQQQQQAQHQQQQAQIQQEREKSIGSVEKMVAEWKKSDIDFPAKEKIIDGQLKKIIKEQNPSPSQIPSIVKNLYEAISAVSPQRQASVNTPLRGNGMTVGKAEPKSSLEAMAQKLGYDA